MKKQKKDSLFSSRLRKARKDNGLTQENVARNLDITTHTYQNWEREVSVPKIDIIIKLASVLDVTLEWLLTGENRGLIREIKDLPTLPLLGEIGCNFNGVNNEILEEAPRVPVPSEAIEKGARYVIHVQGNSMRDSGIFEGDLVAIAPCALEDVDYGSKMIYALLICEGQVCHGAMLKHLRIEDGEVWAVPDNRDMLPRRLSSLGTEARVFGRVVAVTRVLP